MLRVNVTELKNKLSYYLRLVKKGEIIEVMEHSLPIARLEKATSEASSADARIKRMVREGVITLGRKMDPGIVLNAPLVRSKVDPVKILVEERGER